MSPANRRLVAWSAAIAVVAIAGTLAFLARHTLREWIPHRASTDAPAPSASGVAAPEAGTPRGDVSLDARRRQLIGVRTTTVARASTSTPIRAVGVVRADETRLTDVNVKVEGWIRDLRVDYTGQPVNRGQTLFSLYSPDLLATEREYVLAVKNREEVRAAVVPEARSRAESLIASARQRLLQWDLPSDQMARLEQTLEPEATVTFRSPVDGFVLEKMAVAGMHVTPGQTLYRVANLGVVWIEADAYEHDLPAIRVNATARVTLDAYAAEPLTARVAFISPSLQPETRTAKVRFEIANPQGRLKPGMYANVEIGTSPSSALVVPVDALLDSGREQLVFVADGDGTFTPRHVQIGARRQDVVEIASGLKEGDQIASSAAFFLDSESQLRAGVGGYEAGPAAGLTSTAAQLAITLRTQVDPPRTGENTFEVTVKDASGRAIADAEVAIQFFMPAMPTMNMPAMRNTVKVPPVSGGLYRGTGEIMMAGRWEATVSVSRGGQRLGSLQTTVVAR